MADCFVDVVLVHGRRWLKISRVLETETGTEERELRIGESVRSITFGSDDRDGFVCVSLERKGLREKAADENGGREARGKSKPENKK